MDKNKKTYEKLVFENQLLKKEIAECRKNRLSTPDLSENITFDDIFSRNELQKVQDLFAKATGVASIITYPNGIPITKPSNFSNLCQNLIRSTEAGLRNCIKSDSILGRITKGDVYYQPCLSCGLLDGVVLITVGNKHIANWMVGQVKSELSDDEKILNYSQEIDCDRELFEKALAEIPSMKVKQFEDILETLHLFSKALTDKAYKNLQQKYYIKELEKKELQLIEEKKKVEDSDKLKSQFINNLSHEIRTPMNGIIGFTDLMIEEGLPDPTMLKYVQIVQDSTRQLLRIIEDILEISQLDTRQIQVKKASFNLNTLLNELLAIYSVVVEKKQLKMFLNENIINKETRIISDSNILYSILNNLFDNAVKFTHEGTIEIGYTVEESKLNIYVKDTGVGIYPEKQKIIFQRFTQEEYDISRNISGLGLGLPIATENAELLGGSISLSSDKWKGATFIVSIPYEPVTIKPPKKNMDSFYSPVDQNKNAILVVEDDEVSYHLLKSFIINIFKIDCKLFYARNGSEAVEICRNNDEIKMILMDIKMPGMTGFEATRQIKLFKPNLPIIAQTSYYTNEERDKAFSFGFNDFITKPISKEKLLQLINKYYGEPEY